MGNKWQIMLAVDKDEVDLLVAILEFAPRWPFAPVDEIEALKAKVKLAWKKRLGRDPRALERVVGFALRD